MAPERVGEDILSLQKSVVGTQDGIQVRMLQSESGGSQRSGKQVVSLLQRAKDGGGRRAGVIC